MVEILDFNFSLANNNPAYKYIVMQYYLGASFPSSFAKTSAYTSVIWNIWINVSINKCLFFCISELGSRNFWNIERKVCHFYCIFIVKWFPLPFVLNECTFCVCGLYWVTCLRIVGTLKWRSEELQKLHSQLAPSGCVAKLQCTGNDCHIKTNKVLIMTSS